MEDISEKKDFKCGGGGGGGGNWNMSSKMHALSIKEHTVD